MCDGVSECPYNDDEAMCTPVHCPNGCICKGLSFKCRFDHEIVECLPTKTRSLDFSFFKVDLLALQQRYLPLLVHLNLSHSEIESLPETETLAISLGCENLQTLDLSFNNLTSLLSRRFQRMFMLRYLYLEGNPIHTIEDFAFVDLSNVKTISITGAQILTISEFALVGLENLVFLNFSNNKISLLDEMVFSSTLRLTTVDLSYNYLDAIGDQFLPTTEIKCLNLSFNRITFVKNFSFHRLERLTELRLDGNRLTYISYALLQNTLLLQNLNLSLNNIQDVDYGSFKGHTNMISLDIRHNQISVNDKMFLGLVNLKYMYVDSYTICCAKPDSVDPEHCHSPRVKISSCEFLIKEVFLSTGILFLTFLSIVGNIFVLVFRLHKVRWRTIRSYTIFILNLGFSDLLMGMYLFIIAYKDSEFRGVYGFKDTQWRNSGLCTIAGVLATISSEASAMFIFFISIDRLLAIKFRFSRMRFSRRDVTVFCVIVWVVLIVIAIIPTLFWDYFQGQFFSSSGVCISLPLTQDLQHGYEYSVLIFICFNSVLFCMVCIVQILIFREIRESRKRVSGTLSAANRDVKVASTLFAVVLTDVCCWLPIAVLGK